MKPISELEMSNFSQDQGKQRIARRRTDQYAAQTILKLDADIVEKGHWPDLSACRSCRSYKEDVVGR